MRDKITGKFQIVFNLSLLKGFNDRCSIALAKKSYTKLFSWRMNYE